MKLGPVHEGDIVEVDIQGRRFLARVKGKDQTGVCIQPIGRETWRHATAREVIGHWRRSRQSARVREAAHAQD